MPSRDIHRAALTSIIAAAITVAPALDADQTGDKLYYPHRTDNRAA